MKKEIVYRLCRIVFVVLFLFIFSTVREDALAKYDSANKFMKSMPNFVVTELNSNTYKDNGLRQEHKVEIKNTTNKEENVSFVIKNTNDSFPYDYLKYTVYKNGKVVEKGTVTSNNSLFTDKLKGNETSVYEIVFSMDMESIYNLGGVSMSAELAFI